MKARGKDKQKRCICRKILIIEFIFENAFALRDQTLLVINFEFATNSRKLKCRVQLVWKIVKRPANKTHVNNNEIWFYSIIDLTILYCGHHSAV